MFKSINGGENWSAVNTGLTDTYIETLAIAPNALYAGTDFGGVFKSTNGGENWYPINIGLTNTWVWTLAIDSVTPTILYAGTGGGGVFASRQVDYWFYLPLIQRSQ